MHVEDAAILCPYCGEEIFIEVDPSAGRSQEYTEDCQVCCKPIEITIHMSDDGECSVDARTSDA